MPDLNNAPWVDSSLGRVLATPTEDGWNPEYLFQYIYVTATDAIMRFEGPFDQAIDTLTDDDYREASYFAHVPSAITINAASGYEWDNIGLNGIISIGDGSMSATMHVDNRLLMDFHVSVTWGALTTFDQSSLYSWFGPQSLGDTASPTSPFGVAAATLGGWGSFFDSSATTTYILDVASFEFRCPAMNAAASVTGGTSSILPVPASGDILSFAFRAALARPALARRMSIR